VRAERSQVVELAAGDCAEECVVVTGEVFRRAVQDEVGAVLEWAQIDRRRGGGVDDYGCRMCRSGLEVGHREERIRRGLEPHEVDAVGRRAGLVELDDLEPPALELAEQDAGPVIRAFSEGDGGAGGEEGEHERCRRTAAGCEEQRVTAVELSELPLGLDPDRVAVALVDELAGLAVLVRPDRGAVEHEVTLTAAFCRRFARPWPSPPMVR